MGRTHRLGPSQEGFFGGDLEAAGPGRRPPARHDVSVGQVDEAKPCLAGARHVIAVQFRSSFGPDKPWLAPDRPNFITREVGFASSADTSSSWREGMSRPRLSI